MTDLVLVLLTCGVILNPAVILSFFFHILGVLPGINAIMSMKCQIHSKNSINGSHFYYCIRSDHKLENGKTANIVNSIVFSGIFSVFLSPSSHWLFFMFFIYMFINYRHWHWLHSFNKYLLSTFYVVAALLDIGNIMVNETDRPLPKLTVWWLYLIYTCGPRKYPSLL